MSPEQFCAPSLVYSPLYSLYYSHASSHSFPCAVKKPDGEMSCGVHFHSSHQRGERRSHQSKRKKGQQMFRYRRNQQHEKRFALFVQSQCKMRELRSLSESCPCFQQSTGGQRRNRPERWGQGRGGLQGRRWSS